jgi:antitoxin (DNA-binding transcriptional repressor) of toxin-antitoxin stability system
MIRIDRKDFEQSPAACLDKARAGETILITENASPVAELRASPAVSAPPRQLGFAKGMIKMHPSFFDPLSDEELKLWYGE